MNLIRLDFDTKDFADQMKDMATPEVLDRAMGKVAGFWWTEIQNHYATATPPIKESTAKRWGSHPVLQNPRASGMLRGRIFKFVRERDRNNFVCGVYDDAPHAFLFDNKGRRAGSAEARIKAARRRDKAFIGPMKGVRRAGRTAVVGKEKRRMYPEGYTESGWIHWGAMAPRPFMFVDDVMEAYAMRQMDDWMLGFNPS